MAAENCYHTGGQGRLIEDGRRRDRYASSVAWTCDLDGIGPDTPVRWVLNRDTKAIVWLNFREVENGPWVRGMQDEEEDFAQKLLESYPEILERDERPGVTTGAEFPAWVHTIHFLRDDGRYEFVG